MLRRPVLWLSALGLHCPRHLEDWKVNGSTWQPAKGPGSGAEESRAAARGAWPR